MFGNITVFSMQSSYWIPSIGQQYGVHKTDRKKRSISPAIDFIRSRLVAFSRLIIVSKFFNTLHSWRIQKANSENCYIFLVIPTNLIITESKQNQMMSSAVTIATVNGCN